MEKRARWTTSYFVFLSICRRTKSNGHWFWNENVCDSYQLFISCSRWYW